MILDGYALTIGYASAQLIGDRIKAAAAPASYIIFFIPFQYRDKKQAECHVLNIPFILPIPSAMGTYHTLMKI